MKKQQHEIRIAECLAYDVADNADLQRLAPVSSIQEHPTELTALLPIDAERLPSRRCVATPELLEKLKKLSIGAVSTLEATVTGAALGYGLYLIPAIVESTQGHWGYAVVGVVGAANGTLEILNLTGKIPSASMKAIEMFRDSLIVSLGMVRILGTVVNNEYALLGSTVAGTIGLTAAQVGVKHLLSKPATESSKCGCCVKLSNSRFAFHAGRVARAVAPGFVGAFMGAGSLYYGVSIFNNLEFDTNPYGVGAGLLGVGAANAAAQYGYSWPAKLMRNMVDASYAGWFWLLLALDITMDANSDNNTITDVQFMMYCVMSVAIVGMITTKRFMRDQPEVELLDEEEQSSESLDLEQDQLAQTCGDESTDDDLTIEAFNARTELYKAQGMF